MPERSVLQLLGPSTGGIRQHVAELARVLPDLGWEVMVAGPPGVGDGTDLRAVRDVPIPSVGNPLGVLRARSALQRAARDAHLLHAHGLKAGWTASLARTGLPLVVTVHNLVLDASAGRSAGVLRRMEGLLPGRVDAVIAVSEEIAARFGGASDRVFVVPPAGPPPRPARPASEVRRSLEVAPEAPLVVSVARLHPQKDLGTLIAAADRLRNLVPGVRVIIVGEGPLEGSLQRSIDAQGLRDTVLLAGSTANAADHLAAADVVVITSLWESGPLVAAEALLLDRPLVSTPVGYVPQLVDDRVSGRLVPVGDADAVASAVAALLGDPVGAARMGAAGHERVNDLLGPERLVAEVASVYEAVLARRGVSP